MHRAAEPGTGCRLCSVGQRGGEVHSGWTLECRKQKVFCPLRRASHFPLRSNLRATALSLRSSSQWTLMFWPGRAALAKRYGLEGSFTGVENRVNSIKARGPGLWTSHSLDFMRGWKVNYLPSLSEVHCEKAPSKRGICLSTSLWKIKAIWTRGHKETLGAGWSDGGSGLPHPHLASLHLMSDGEAGGWLRGHWSLCLLP